jgi:hypothetical protein
MLQVRYVEYRDDKRVYVAPWQDYIDRSKVPKGCLVVGWMTRAEALRIKKKFANSDRKNLFGNNFEYRIV